MSKLGLSTNEVREKIKKFGLNDVHEKKNSILKKILPPLYSPMSLMLLGAALLSYFAGKTFDVYFILFLYFTNYGLQKWQEFKADKAIELLKEKLSFNVLTLRDGAWIFVNAKELVPGDYVRLGLGTIIPTDGEVVVHNNLTINEAVLTGESMPVEKTKGSKVFSGSYVATGSLEVEVTATGKNTSFGKTIFSIEQSTQKSILEQDMLIVTRFLTMLSIFAAIILSIVLSFKGHSLEDLLTLDLSLIIAGIPIALPAVMTIILSIGAAGLTKKMVVVRRLSALQDLANVNLLLTDKTGTLTKNQIQIVKVISYQPEISTADVVEYSGYGTLNQVPDAINQAIIKKAKEEGRSFEGISVLSFVPYDSIRKRTTVNISKESKQMLVSLGAPQVISELCRFQTEDFKRTFENDINLAAGDGYRTLALAIKKDEEQEEGMEIAGLLYLADPIDEKSKETLAFMKKNAIDVKMVTGDNKAIARRVAEELGLTGRVLSQKETGEFYKNEFSQKESDGIAVFAEIAPKDKYELVNKFKQKYIVASTGDGINDLPALKAANVGIAVPGAVSALKSMADIVLLGEGLSVIQDAILESRKIFVRLYNYSIYRISESFRLIITILILGVLYGFYPLLPIQIILLALLNDLPIISLAFDRVETLSKPAEIKTKERFTLSLLFGSVGTVNSLILFVIMTHFLHLPLEVIQTIFFLKLAISGHALVFVAHTQERWYKFLPSKEVIIATLTTQAIATTLAITGFLMPIKISPMTALLVWFWALLWMQVSEAMKFLQRKFV